MKLKVIILLLHTAKNTLSSKVVHLPFVVNVIVLSAYLLLADQTQRYKSYMRMRLQMHLKQTKTSCASVHIS